MGRPAISNEEITSTIAISECHADSNHPRGFWLYDKTRGMNLAMGAPSKEAALAKALMYYQKRLLDIEYEYKELHGKVMAFVDQFSVDEED